MGGDTRCDMGDSKITKIITTLGVQKPKPRIGPLQRRLEKERNFAKGKKGQNYAQNTILHLGM